MLYQHSTYPLFSNLTGIIIPILSGKWKLLEYYSDFNTKLMKSELGFGHQNAHFLSMRRMPRTTRPLPYPKCCCAKGFYLKLRKEELKLWRNNNGYPSSNSMQRLVSDLHQALGHDLKCGAWQKEEAGSSSLFLEREKMLL